MLSERIHSFDVAGNRIHFDIDQIALLGVLEGSVFESMRNQVDADAGPAGVSSTSLIVRETPLMATEPL
mgnify:CR=1 FL=1